MTEQAFTVLGANGFVGGAMARFLKARGFVCHTPEKGDESIFKFPLGHVIYAVGLTADFRTRPFDTVEAHVCLLRRLLQEGTFSSLVYLSSTRVYAASARTDESAPTLVDVNVPDFLYNISKLMGESLSLHCGRAGVRVARLSNVVGLRFDTDTFIDQILAEGFSCGAVHLRTSLTSCKDYIHIDDVVTLLAGIAMHGRHGLYNVASGIGVSNQHIAALLAEYTGISVSVAEDAATREFSPINTDRITSEFGFTPRAFDKYFLDHIQQFKQQLSNRGKHDLS